MSREYRQHCALAHALDMVGERWTLLIVRELLTGPRRYTDLARGLVTAPSNVLAARLRELEALGLILRQRLPAPAEQVVVYELTDEGTALSDAVAALAAWGLRSLPSSPDGSVFRSRWLILAMEARFDPDAAAGLEESYQLEIEGDEPVHFVVSHGEGRGRPGLAESPVVRVSADAATLLALADAEITIADAAGRGARIEGSDAAIERMLRVLPPRAGASNRTLT
jgi:DNA-binding HxlR family transcriptional regulator